MKTPIRLKTYLLTTLLALAFGLIHLSTRFEWSESILSQNNLRALSDAFFLPGFMLFNFGLIVIVDNHEGFDFLRYSMSKFWQLVRRVKDPDGPKSFYEYRTQASTRSKSNMYIPLMIVGVTFILINIIFWLLFNYYYPTL